MSSVPLICGVLAGLLFVCTDLVAGVSSNGYSFISDSKLRHIGLGARHRGKPIVLFVADRDVRIVTEDGELLRELVLDPSRDYQRQSA